MNIKDIHTGMKVRISNDISITKARHSAGHDMYKMCGKVYRVRGVENSSHRDPCVRIEGYVWAPEDLIPLEVEKVKPQIFHYDVDTLEI